MDVNSTTDMPMRKQKQKVLKDVKKAVKKRLREVENQRINNKMIKIEEMKNDSSRYFAALVLKEVQRERKQENLVVEDKNNKIAATEEEQVKIVSEYFREMLAPEGNESNILEFPPLKMVTPFTADKITKAAKKLKNGKSPGPDNVQLELIIYAPIELHKEIATIFNKIAETGEPVTESVLGLLRPLQKPGKAKGLPENLRPIILPSVLRKILTIYLIDRTWDRLRLRPHGNDIVPLSYRSDFWNGKVDCSHGSGPLSYQFSDLFTRVRYRIVPKHFAPKQAKENLICQQISNTAE